ncbi:hypothetical protein, partial [Bacteroides thetaiotaomicron]
SLAFAANQASNASDEPVAGGISQITRRTLIDDVTSHYSTQFWRAASILPRSFGAFDERHRSSDKPNEARGSHRQRTSLRETQRAPGSH